MSSYYWTVCSECSSHKMAFITKFLTSVTRSAVRNASSLVSIVTFFVILFMIKKTAAISACRCYSNCDNTSKCKDTSAKLNHWDYDTVMAIDTERSWECQCKQVLSVCRCRKKLYGIVYLCCSFDFMSSVQRKQLCH